MVIDDNAQSLLARGRHPETKKQTKQKQQTMGTPLRFDMILPNGQPLRYGMAGARWNGTVEEVMAALAQQNNTTHNMNNNKSSAAMSAQDLTDVTSAYATIRAKMPFLLNLPPDERAHLAHMGDKTVGILQPTRDFIAQFPEALPADFILAEFNKDCDLFAPLDASADASAAANQAIQDTRLALRSDLLYAILDIYACAKANNRGGRYQTYVDYMKAHFARPRKPKTPPTP